MSLPKQHTGDGLKNCDPHVVRLQCPEIADALERIADYAGTTDACGQYQIAAAGLLATAYAMIDSACTAMEARRAIEFDSLASHGRYLLKYGLGRDVS